VTTQAEELARTAEQLQALVARFHAGVGADADIDGDAEDEAQTVVARRRADDWAGAESEEAYVRRAS
jgi:hypothetical protein